MEASADRFIEIDAFETGPRPRISRDRDVTDRAVWLDKPSYWRLGNLEIADAAVGNVAYYTTNDHVGLRFQNIYTHHNDVVLGARRVSYRRPTEPSLFQAASNGARRSRGQRSRVATTTGRVGVRGAVLVRGATNVRVTAALGARLRVHQLLDVLAQRFVVSAMSNRYHRSSRSVNIDSKVAAFTQLRHLRTEIAA